MAAEVMSGVFLKEACRWKTVWSNGGRIIGIANVHCTSSKGFVLLVVSGQQICRSLRNKHGIIIPRLSRLPNSLLNLLFFPMSPSPVLYEREAETIKFIVSLQSTVPLDI
ncbi:hypothetical protein F3Y22_tig00116976pilonHSYRG00117 [Hibiscus syriacus]|uniref:Uncharacterized protein n=1 Tax=Hibiscus syriacus TaxID=106335 RepID=A0A6A2WGA9_HIBSY|nr:hypothetical protein F3Y22_tig00116976pilonHSYRG00117 [Hibiscus syriacus]